MHSTHNLGKIVYQQYKLGMFRYRYVSLQWLEMMIICVDKLITECQNKKINLAYRKCFLFANTLFTFDNVFLLFYHYQVTNEEQANVHE